MQLLACSKHWIETNDLPGPSAVICMADEPGLLARIRDSENVKARLDLCFHDTSDAGCGVSVPQIQHARQIVDFAAKRAAEWMHRGIEGTMICQCEAGVSRSMAVCAALAKISGHLDAIGDHWRKTFTYNRRLYRLILEAAGHPLPREPLVSMICRVKYSRPCRTALYCCVLRQRYENWELIFTSDGPEPELRGLDLGDDRRVRFVESPVARGRWGHPWRQLGIDAAKGEFIVLTNDDNYYVPGFLEQMVAAMQGGFEISNLKSPVDMACCQILHSYSAWQPIEAGADLGSWMVRAELMRKFPWSKHAVNESGEFAFNSDQRYFRFLASQPGVKVAKVERPLFVHN